MTTFRHSHQRRGYIIKISKKAEIFVKLHGLPLQIRYNGSVVKSLIMATISAKIFKHHKKADGTFNVKICVAHKEDRVYMDTTHFVTSKQITKDFKVKDHLVLSAIHRIEDNYRKAISDLEYKLESFSAKTLREFLLKKDEKVDFLKFCQIYIDQLDADGRSKSCANYKTVRNSLVDFLDGQTTLLAQSITLDFLKGYERFLRGPRKMVRKDRLGRAYNMTGKPLPDASVHIYLRDFQGFFSAAMAYYNKPSLGIAPITHNPFKEFKIVDAPATEKRSLELNEIIKIRDCKTKANSRAELAKKMSMLSFYMCGMNAVDFYKQDYCIKMGRLEYSRSKTKDKRKDKAFISIKVPQEAEELLLYAAKVTKKYSTIDNFNRAISHGMAALSESTEIPGLQYYKLRHSFGNHARNTCRKSKDDVSLALNHVDHGKKTTDIYLKKDWTIVDEVQEAVINLIRPKKTIYERQNVNPIFGFINLPKLK